MGLLADLAATEPKSGRFFTILVFTSATLAAYWLVFHLPKLQRAQPCGGGHKPFAAAGSEHGSDFEVKAVRFTNRSLGLNHHVNRLGSQCPEGWPEREQQVEGFETMRYAANRKWLADPGLARGVIVMALDNENDSLLHDYMDNPRIVQNWPTWTRFFFPAIRDSAAMVILLDAANTNTTAVVAEKLGMHRLTCMGVHKRACEVAGKLDQGYDIYVSPLGRHMHFTVFMGLRHLETPWWVLRAGKTEADLKAESWQPELCWAPYTYWKMTALYQAPMLRLQILDYFDYFLKVDDDVVFHNRMPLDVVARVAANQSLFMHTKIDWDNWECQGELPQLINWYLDVESGKCGRLFRPTAENEEWYDDLRRYWYANFIAGWLGLFTSPEVLQFANTLHNHYDNHRHRWADQGFFTAAMAIFDKGTDNVLDLSSLRRQEIFCHKKCGEVYS